MDSCVERWMIGLDMYVPTAYVRKLRTFDVPVVMLNKTRKRTQIHGVGPLVQEPSAES